MTNNILLARPLLVNTMTPTVITVMIQNVSTLFIKEITVVSVELAFPGDLKRLLKTI